MTEKYPEDTDPRPDDVTRGLWEELADQGEPEEETDRKAREAGVLEEHEEGNRQALDENSPPDGTPGRQPEN